MGPQLLNVCHVDTPKGFLPDTSDSLLKNDRAATASTWPDILQWLASANKLPEAEQAKDAACLFAASMPPTGGLAPNHRGMSQSVAASSGPRCASDRVAPPRSPPLAIAGKCGLR